MKKISAALILMVLLASIMFSSCTAEPEIPEEMLTVNVSAKVIDVFNNKKMLLVSGLDEDSPLGTQCYVTGYEEGFTVRKLTENEYTNTSFGNIVEGDVVTLTLVGDVKDGFPSQAEAFEFLINPVRTNPVMSPMALWHYYTEKLDESLDLASLLDILAYPEAAPIKDISITPGDNSSITVIFDADASYLDLADLNPYDQNAVTLFGLIKDLDELVYVFGEQDIPYSRTWVESVVSSSLINRIENAEDVGALLTIVYDTSSAYEDYYTAVVYDVMAGASTGVELYSSTERDPINDLRDLLVYEGEPIAESKNDAPVDVSQYMFINIAILDLSTTIIEQYYVYEKDGLMLMEIPNEGIWEMDENAYNTLTSLK